MSNAMKFSVGYQMRQSDDFIRKIIDCKEQIAEVYFSWGDFANGRNSCDVSSNLTMWEIQQRQFQDLKQLADCGLRFNLLLNATCYGRESQSKALFHKIGNAVDYISQNLGLCSITTTSLLIAKFIKSNFKNIDVRASVNMEIGTIEGFSYVEDYFDSFYMKRELNRDFAAMRSLKQWCEKNGKVLYALANSGCFNHCSAHVFHDNLVSHEAEIAQMDNGYAFSGVCREFISKDQSKRCLIENTNFIRPEDVPLYEGLFPAMKLATRVNPNPITILDAYLCKERYSGSVLSLLEPDHTAVVYPRLLENSKLKSKIYDEKLVYSNFEQALIQLEDYYVDKCND